MKIGSLIQIKSTYHTSNNGAIGVIIEKGVHHNGDWKYRILFANGSKGWWTQDRLEVLCK